MSDPLPPHVPQDVQETPYQQQYYAHANGASVHQNPPQPGAAHSHYSQHQKRIYADNHQDSSHSHYSQHNPPSISYQPQWNSLPVPYSHFNVPSYPYQQSQNASTPAATPSVAPSDHGTRQYISRQQQSTQMQYTKQEYGQPPESYWPRQRYPQQPTYPDGFHSIVNVSHRSGAHEAPQQFRDAPNAVLPGGNASAGLRVEQQKRHGGLSAKAAGKRKAVANDDDDSRFGESSSGSMKRFRSHASAQQVPTMAPPPASNPNFNATGVMRAPSSSPFFEMSGMYFQANHQFEASGTQSHQQMSSTQNGSSTLRPQVPRGYYNQDHALPQGWQAQHAHHETSNASSQTVQQSSQVSSVVDRYSGRNEQSRSYATIFQSVSLLRELLRTGCKGEPGDCWGILNEKTIVLIRVRHQEKPGTLRYSGIASLDTSTDRVRIITDPHEAHFFRNLMCKRVWRTINSSGPSLPTPARTPAPDAAMHLNKGSNGFAPSAGYFPHSSGQALPTPVRTPLAPTQNGFQPSADYFAGPSFPTSARTSVQPVPIQPPPSIPLITTDVTGTLPVDDCWSTAPVQESLRVQIADSGENEPRVPISHVDRPTTLLPDERHVDDSVGKQAKEETSGDLTDTPRYQEFVLEQPVASTTVTVNGFQSSPDYFSCPSGQTLPTPARTPIEPDAGFQMQNLQQSADNLVDPSVHALPTSVHAAVQSATIQAPPPVPVIMDNATSTALAPVENSVVQKEDSGEGEPQLPPSPVPGPTTLLTDEKQAHTADGQVKTEEDWSDDPFPSILGAMMTDMSWYQEFAASAQEEQPIASTLANSVEVPSKTDDDGATDDKEYHRVYTEFMVDDDEEGDGDGDGASLFGSPSRKRR
ncbi:hypothetical protein IW261DRAFT_1606396 [Armillaria novae-zelandiae]|uniref:Uncharacterized protein n=1 Tax=Armillaria novae-zelandiae TaxID=153914 RepID=A0AA39PE60_9AGAR|nr:hypothetical protein IW261DRAFT_1606396 [Armillaria novae-zelandiae]